jgi:hypothetical protein
MVNEHIFLMHPEGAWSHQEHLDDLLKALDGRRELVEPAVGSTLRWDVAAVSVWVKADGKTNAEELANRARVPPAVPDWTALTSRGHLPIGR